MDHVSSIGDDRTPRVSQRLPSLDGARAVMALAVVLCHCLLIVGPWVGLWISRTGEDLRWSWGLLDADFLTRAIVVFFLLSGLVVSLQASRSGHNWPGYFASRLLRLYLPAWASIGFAVVLILVIPRGFAPMDNWLGATNATDLSAGQLLNEATLLPQKPLINNPLWSLSWEVVFSVLLPLYIRIARKVHRHWIWAIVVCVLVMAVGFELRVAALQYLPSFLIGSIAGLNIDKIKASAQSIRSSHRHRVWWWAILVASIVWIIGYRLTGSLQLVKPFTFLNHALGSTTVVGYMGLLFIAMGASTAIRLLETRLMQWLGAISFSIYLVHVPILVTLAFLFEGRVWLVPLIGIPLSVAFAAVFAWWVEWPAHRFARRIGNRMAIRYPAQPGGLSR